MPEVDIYLWAGFAAAYGLDLLLGDPEWLCHPVRLIGSLIRALEDLLRGWARRFGKEAVRAKTEKFLGILLTLVTVSGTVGVVWLILELARQISPLLYHLVNCYFLYTAFATRCLADEALKVRTLLANDDLPGARRRVGMLVGRETGQLNKTGLIRAVVETTAENTVDGVVSPMFYAVIGALLGVAAPLAYGFKAINTLDSMVGYQNERYRNFGWASAKLDDIANFLPARLAGFLIPVAALLSGKDFRRSLLIMLRDRKNHASPNCAYPEAAVAGALGIKLGGANIYFGRPVSKPTIGDELHPLAEPHIGDVVRLMLITSLLMLVIGLIVLLECNYSGL